MVRGCVGNRISLSIKLNSALVRADDVADLGNISVKKLGIGERWGI